ncbi:hypothetical protein DFH09DRAFT_500518 [Mycena vulgaris]|nr:hypothetical protein DFH09DRAFT_500518 [Mycena vulgaris]
MDWLGCVGTCMSCGSDSRHLYHRVVCLRRLRLFSAPASRPPRPLALPPRPSYISSSVLLCRHRSSPSIRVHYTSSASATPAPSLTAPRLFPPALLLPSYPPPAFFPRLCIIIARAPAHRFPLRRALRLPLHRWIAYPRGPRALSPFHRRPHSRLACPRLPTSSGAAASQPSPADSRPHPSAQEWGGDEQKRGGLVDGLLAMCAEPLIARARGQGYIRIRPLRGW